MLCCVAASLGLLQSIVHADTPPPARVGRIAFLDGDVRFYADRAEGWQKARLNFPVTSRNSVWTAPNARAEVRIGASALRLDGDAIVDFVLVDDERTKGFLQRGTLNVRLRAYEQDDYRDTFRIETTEGPAILESNGRYRIDAAPGGNETRLTVFAGRARFDNAGSVLTIDSGRALRIRNAGGAFSFQFETAGESSFDRWAESRDRRWDDEHRRVARGRILSPRMTGYEELDGHGDWDDHPEYGRIWAPRTMVAGWAPYRFGSWVSVHPWGWTWVDDAVWGFAPFHYGRWVFLRARWWWCPGAYAARPVFAPALVAWVGSPGAHVTVFARLGPVAWFPLGPREYYVPGYTGNTTYIRNINNVTNVTVVQAPTQYVNRGAGQTVAGSGAFVNGEPVWVRGAVPRKPAIDPRSLAAAPVVGTPPPRIAGEASRSMPGSTAPVFVRGEARTVTTAPALVSSNPPAPRVSGQPSQSGTPQGGAQQAGAPQVVGQPNRAGSGDAREHRERMERERQADADGTREARNTHRRDRARPRADPGEHRGDGPADTRKPMRMPEAEGNGAQPKSAPSPRAEHPVREGGGKVATQ